MCLHNFATGILVAVLCIFLLHLHAIVVTVLIVLLAELIKQEGLEYVGTDSELTASRLYAEVCA